MCCSRSVCQVTLTRRGWSTFDYVITLPKRWNAGVTNPDCIPHQRVFFFFSFLSFFFNAMTRRWESWRELKCTALTHTLYAKSPCSTYCPHTRTLTQQAGPSEHQPVRLSSLPSASLHWVEGNLKVPHYAVIIIFIFHPIQRRSSAWLIIAKTGHFTLLQNLVVLAPRLKWMFFFHWLHLKLVEASSFIKATSVGQHWPPKNGCSFSKLVHFYFVCLYLKKKQLNEQKNKTRKQQTLSRSKWFAVGGRALRHTLHSCFNHCPPSVPPTHPNVESWKLNMALTIKPIPRLQNGCLPLLLYIWI